jgi:thiol-disulfide isomerase/thioredoxin
MPMVGRHRSVSIASLIASRLRSVQSRRIHPAAEVAAWAIVFALFVVVGFVGGGGEAPQARDITGEPAPPLAGPALDGNGTIDLAGLKGRPTVVVFWLPWCDHCRELLSELDAAWKAAAPDANILTAGMEYDDPDSEPPPGFENAGAFVDTTGLGLPSIAADWDRMRDDWGFRSVPTVFILDADHVVREIVRGRATDAAEIVAAVGG